MSSDKFSALDILDLPDLERSIFRYLMARSSTAPADLYAALPAEAAEIDGAISRLIGKGRVTRGADGALEAVSGRVTRRTSLPPQFWSPFVASPRSFSAKDIQTLRVATPILQFVRLRLAEFNDHGPTHARRVRDYATQLGCIVGLTATEQFYLRVAALFHDVGNAVDRKSHHIVSQQTVERLAALGELPLTPEEAAVAGLVCRWHRKEYDPDRVDVVNGESVRTGLLGSIIRVADAMDIDLRRSDYSAQIRSVLEFFLPDELPFWASLDVIYGVRICCDPDVHLQVFTRGYVADNMQINMLRGDLASTPLGWTVEQIPVPESAAQPSAEAGKALLAFPFDAHSLVMAAISRKHLRAAGREVQTLCYANTADSAQALWRDDLGDGLARDLTRLVLIGGRLRENDTSLVAGALSRIVGRGAQVSILNRYEQTWNWSSWLLQPGVEVILGGDWAYFWGAAADEADLRWGRVAALCGRDPAQAALRFTPEETRLANGLLMLVHDRLKRNRFDDAVNWTALAEPLLSALERDDQAFFEPYSDQFLSVVAPTVTPRREGRVLVFDDPGDVLPNDLYWMLETAVEREGLALEHAVQFRFPYAIVVSKAGDALDLLAIRHWREEIAPPIRLRFPDDPSLTLEGNENTVYLRLPSERAGDLLRALIAACNRDEVELQLRQSL